MFKAKFWNEPITLKGYVKFCGAVYAIFAVIYAAFFGYMFRENIADWFHDRFSRKKKETAYKTSVFEEDFDEE